MQTVSNSEPVASIPQASVPEIVASSVAVPSSVTDNSAKCSEQSGLQKRAVQTKCDMPVVELSHQQDEANISCASSDTCFSEVVLGDGDTAGEALVTASLSQVCSKCKCTYAEAELSQWSNTAGTELCTLCCFREMDPFRPVGEVQHILYSDQALKRQLSFKIDLPDLRQWRKDGQEVEVRMLRLRGLDVTEHGSRLQQAWPRFMNLKVNGHEVLSVKPPLKGHKRRDVPHSITVNLRRGVNEVELCIEDDKRGDFALAVVRTTPSSPRQLAKGIRCVPGEQSLSRVRALLAARPKALTSGNAGDGVECVGDERLQLRCPITLSRPASVPARGMDCRHLQCLDLDAYLVSNFRTKAFNSRWRCPICSLELRLEDLCIDSFVESVLSATDAVVADVWVAPDGSWRVDESLSSSADKAQAVEKGGGETGMLQARATACVVDDGFEDDFGAKLTQPVSEMRRVNSSGHNPSRHTDSGRRRRRSPSNYKGGICEHSKHKRRRHRSRERRHRYRSPIREMKAASKSSRVTRVRRSAQHSAGSKTTAFKRSDCAGVMSSGRTGTRKPMKGSRAGRAHVAPPHRAIAVDSDAPPEVVSDSGGEKDTGVEDCANIIGEGNQAAVDVGRSRQPGTSVDDDFVW